jgi:hypothetical protein
MPDAEKESISGDENGLIFTLSYAMLVNDDMGAFLDIARNLGRTAALSVEEDFFNLFALNSGSGPVMSDSNNLFDETNHGNVASTGGAVSVATLAAARKAMRSQKDPGGNSYIDVRPEILLVPLGHEDEAWEVVNSTADPAGNHEAVRNREFNRWTIVSSPYVDEIDADAWYALARPARAAAFQVGFVGGNRNPMVETEEAFSSRGIQYRVTHDYGVAAVDYRPIYKNPGA